MAFDLAVRHFQIDPLLDPEDVNTNKPDKKSILMYVMCLYHAIDLVQSQLSKASSIQTLDQHFEAAGSSEEIQLLHEREIGIVEEEEEEVDEGQAQAEIFHVGHLNDLDEVSLAKSIDDLSKFPTPSLKRSSTFTITNNADSEVTERIPQTADGPATSFQTFMESHSRPISTATNASVELGGYQNAIEVVLALLLEAEETLSRHLPEIKDLSEAKAQFQEHEDFMIKLSEYQEYVGSALEEGARLLQEPSDSVGLSSDDQNEIKQQMLLLNERWETLRMSALEVQSRVHGRLAEIQLRKIEELRVHLTDTEDRISRMADIDPNPDAMQRQLQEHRELELLLNEQKHLVDDLSNLVVIVNDDLFGEMEDKLAALGERWSHVVKWTKNRFEKLQRIETEWKLMNRRYRILERWLSSRENNLKDMEMNAVTQIGSVMERMNNLKFCAVDLNLLYEHLLKLEETARPFLPSTDSLLINVESLEDRCEALKDIVEIQQRRIERLGFDFSVDDSVTNAILPQDWTNYHSKLNRSLDTNSSTEDNATNIGTSSDSDSTEKSPQSRKKRKIQKSSEHQSLEQRVEEMITFVAAGEQTLVELQSVGSLKQQRDVLEQLQVALEQKISEYAAVKMMLKSCTAKESETDFSCIERQIGEVASKYDELNFRLEHQINENDKNLAYDKFQRNLTGLKLVLADCQDWYKQNATLNAATMEDLQNRIEYMDSLDSEIEEAKIFCSHQEKDSVQTWREDLELFLQSWTDIKSAVQRILQEKFGIAVEAEEQLAEAENFYKNVDEAMVDYSNAHSMKINLEKLNELKQKIEDFRQSYEEIASDVIQKCSQILDEKIIKQATAIDNTNHFITEYESVQNSLNKLNDKLLRDEFIAGEQNDLKNQFKLYEILEKEIKKIEIDIASVKNFSEIITRESKNVQSVKQMQSQLKSLNELYSKIVELYEKNKDKMNKCILRTDEIVTRISQIETWLNELEASTPSTENADINNSNELFHLRSRFQSLKETCEQKTITFRELNERGSEILLQIDEQSNHPNKCTSLAKQFTKLNARWNEVTTLVYNRCGLLEHISNQLGEFKTLIVSENGHLDKLEKCLRKSPENAADAEEIYEDLDVITK